MKVILLLFTVLGILSCKNYPQKQIHLLDTNIYAEMPDTGYIEPSQKHFYSVIIITRPIIRGSYDSEYTSDLESLTKVSSIQSTYNWSTDIEYSALDNFENSLRPEIDTYDEIYKSQASVNLPGMAFQKTLIMSRKSYVFNSYKEASESRRMVLDKPEKYDPLK